MAVTSGTSALHLALRLSGIGAGDEVMVSTLTFCASVNPILYQGATLIFIDSERGSWNLDPDLLEEELSKRAESGTMPKALALVHLYGQCADIEPIVALCERYGVILIEDAAEAFGARYWGWEEGRMGRVGRKGRAGEREEGEDGEAVRSGVRSSNRPVRPYRP